MATTYDKDKSQIVTAIDGVAFNRSIKWEDCIVSVPAPGNEKVDMVYINGSDQLVLVLEDESEIIVIADLATHEAAADPHAGYVLESIFNADTFLYASVDNVPVATSPANVLAALSGHADAAFSWNGQNLTSVGDVAIGANKITTTNLLLKEYTSNEFIIFNTTEDVVKGLALGHLGVYTAAGIRAYVNAMVMSARQVNANYLIFQAYKTDTGPLEVARLTGAATPTFDLLAGRLTGALDANGQAITGHAQAITDNALLTVDGASNANEYARFTANGLVGRTEAEFKGDFNLEIGTDVLAEQTVGIADDNLLEVDGSPNDDEFARFTANGIEGLTVAESLAALSPLTTRGDIMFRNATVSTRLAKGTEGQVLAMGADDPEWSAAGSGDVTGPASSTDNEIARQHSTTGKVLQTYTSNPPTISDTGDVNIDGDLDVENIVVSGTVDGKDVSGLATAAESVSAVEAAGLTLAVAKYITITTPTGDHTASGWAKTETAGTNLAFGEACYVGTDAKMEKALADDAAITIPATHICISETINEDATGLFLIYGEVYDASWSFDIGKSVYLDKDTAGVITKTMPTKVTGNQVQFLGQCVMTTAKILWTPSPIVVEYA